MTVKKEEGRDIGEGWKLNLAPYNTFIAYFACRSEDGWMMVGEGWIEERRRRNGWR